MRSVSLADAEQELANLVKDLNKIKLRLCYLQERRSANVMKKVRERSEKGPRLCRRVLEALSLVLGPAVVWRIS